MACGEVAEQAASEKQYRQREVDAERARAVAIMSQSAFHRSRNADAAGERVERRVCHAAFSSSQLKYSGRPGIRRSCACRATRRPARSNAPATVRGVVT